MRLRISVVCVFLMIPLVLLSSSCRTRTRRVAPRADPISFSSPVTPEAQLASSEPDFLAADPEPRVERSDLSELNRRAHQDGWIRDAFFAFDSSRLDAAARTALHATAEWLRDHPEMNLLIEGHCDERGTAAYNLALGDHRAETARQYLVLLGIDPNRLSTISYGEERPFALGSNERAWAQNRRAHLVLRGMGRG